MPFAVGVVVCRNETFFLAYHPMPVLTANGARPAGIIFALQPFLFWVQCRPRLFFVRSSGSKIDTCYYSVQYTENYRILEKLPQY